MKNEEYPFVNGRGAVFRIEREGSKAECSVIFKNGYIKKKVPFFDAKRGKVFNPYVKSCFGVGFKGEGYYNSVNSKKSHQCWRNILRRCYNKKYQNRRPSYKGVTVCEEWHNFQNFAKWFEDNYNPETMEGWQIDKDILCPECREYSPENCCFVPREVNQLLVRDKNLTKTSPIGTFENKNGSFYVRLNRDKKMYHVGVYNTSEEAFKAYKEAKERYIKEVADKWKDELESKVYEAMYKIEINE